MSASATVFNLCQLVRFLADPLCQFDPLIIRFFRFSSTSDLIVSDISLTVSRSLCFGRPFGALRMAAASSATEIESLECNVLTALVFAYFSLNTGRSFITSPIAGLHRSQGEKCTLPAAQWRSVQQEALPQGALPDRREAGQLADDVGRTAIVNSAGQRSWSTLLVRRLLATSLRSTSLGVFTNRFALLDRTGTDETRAKS